MINPEPNDQSEIDFTTLKEGDTDPNLGKRIKTLIFSAEDFVVYLDDDDYVEWFTSERYEDYPDDFGEVTNKVSLLESISMMSLEKKGIQSIGRLLAEGMARLLDDHKTTNALLILKEAETILKEKARIWYLSSSCITTLFFILTISIVGIASSPIQNIIGAEAFDIFLGSCFGAIGAFISIFIRSKKIPINIMSGRRIHYFEGALRIFFGILGALTIALGIKANIIAGLINDINKTSQTQTLLYFICTIAGASERIVPSLISQFELKFSQREG